MFDKISKLEKKGYQGKILSESALKEIIKKHEDVFKNSRHTATEEKKYIDTIENLKASMPLAAEAESHRKQAKAHEQRIKETLEVSKPLYDLRNQLSEKIKLIRNKLTLNKAKDEKKTPEERAAEKEKQKKDWVESPEEIKLRNEIKLLKEQIKELKQKKNDLKEKHNTDVDAFYTQKREIDKIECMWDIMDKLKHEEKKKKTAEELVKRKEEALKEAKAHLLIKYQKEIDICEYLLGLVEQTKLLQKMKNSPWLKEGKDEIKVNQDSLKKENLVLFISKKEKEEGVQPGQKKQGKKAKKEVAEVQKVEEDNFELDAPTLENFQTLKIAAPKTLEEFEKTTVLISEKKEEYLNKRQQEIENFDANPPEIKLYGDRPVYDGERRRGPREDRKDGQPREDRRRIREDGEPREDRKRNREDGEPREDRRRNREEGKKEEGDKQEVTEKAENAQKIHPKKKIEYNEESFPTI